MGAEGSGDDVQKRGVMHLSQTEPYPSPPQHADSAQRPGQGHDRGMRKGRAWEGEHGAGHAGGYHGQDQHPPQAGYAGVLDLRRDEPGEHQAEHRREQGRPHGRRHPPTAGQEHRQCARHRPDSHRDDVLGAGHRHQEAASVPGHRQPPGRLVGAQEERAESVERPQAERKEQQHEGQQQPARVQFERSRQADALARRGGTSDNQPAQVGGQDHPDDGYRQEPGVDVSDERPHAATMPSGAPGGPPPQVGAVGKGLRLRLARGGLRARGAPECHWRPSSMARTPSSTLSIRVSRPTRSTWVAASSTISGS